MNVTRLEVYRRALEVCRKIESGPDPATVADALLDFVKDSRLRLDVIDLAIERLRRRQDVVSLVSEAEKIADWVEPVVSTPVFDTRSTQTTVTQKRVSSHKN